MVPENTIGKEKGRKKKEESVSFRSMSLRTTNEIGYSILIANREEAQKDIGALTLQIHKTFFRNMVLTQGENIGEDLGFLGRKG